MFLNQHRGISYPFILASLFVLIPLLALSQNESPLDPTFRPPAVPLVTHDPYFSIWSPTDRLTDTWTTHWTGKTQALCGLVRIDGKPFRIISTAPDDIPAMEQKSLLVYPTRTVYEFEAQGVHLTLTFLSPVLPYNLDVMSRPVTYITWEAKAIDDGEHAVSVYLDATGELAVNVPTQSVQCSRAKIGGMDALRIGTVEQPVLQKRGDDLRIDWGYAYLVIPTPQHAQTVIGRDNRTRETFARSGSLPDSDDLQFPRPTSERWPVIACALDLGEVGAEPVSNYVMLAYDDIFSIEYFYRRLQPYWRQSIDSFSELIITAAQDYRSLSRECAQFDQEILQDLSQVGGPKFAQLCSLAFRQCIAAHKLVTDFDGTPLYFSKENFSNGCIATVDVTYPSSPFFLLFNPELLKAQLVPILDYAQSKRWKFPFAPHDLGTYPQANGQVYGGGERNAENQMPVEESGNMLLMIAAIAQVNDSAEFAQPYWPTLSKWANYLKEQGMDPANQLCTDDFAGHLAHNANLSLKAILALGGYAQLCERLGYKDEAASTMNTAKEMAQQWLTMADDGDHYRLAFDRPGTWSQKYNLVWDELLGLNLFPNELEKKEVIYYKTKTNTFGLPLDNRKNYTKTDWELWTMCLTDNPEDFAFFMNPIYKFANETPERVPLTDWYDTQTSKKVGFQARSVIGGVFIPMLKDSSLWSKWAKNKN